MFGQDELNEAMIHMKNYVDAKHDLLVAQFANADKDDIQVAELNIAEAEGELERYDN